MTTTRDSNGRDGIMTCLLDCRLDAANSGQVERSICRKEAMSTTVPAVAPRCHSSKESGV